jgi:hypothetical protein
MSRWLNRFRTQASVAWEEFKSWHRPLPVPPERWASYLEARRRFIERTKRLVQLSPRAHREVWQSALRDYRRSWKMPDVSGSSPANAEIENQIAAQQIASAEKLRAAAGRNVVANAKGMSQAAPAVASWARDQLFLLRLSVRSFLAGYAEGKAEAESRDWFRIQQQIFADSDSSTKASSEAKPTNAATAADAAPPSKPTTTTTASSSSSTTSSSLQGVEFVRKPKKPREPVK